MITAYHPDARLSDLVDALRPICSDVVVVDNTPAADVSASAGLDGGRVCVVRTGRNRGLAAALNDGIARLPQTVTTVLLLDQDSVVSARMIAALADLLHDGDLSAVGPLPVDPESGEPYDRSVRRGEVEERDSIITSGMLVRRSVLASVGGFREDFFVDWVDNDFCLRLRDAGLRVAVDRRQHMPHSIGHARVHRLVGERGRIRVLHYPTWRHYWTSRNAVILMREHAWSRPRWVVDCVLYVGRQALTAIVYERSRAHVTAVLRGLRDGARDQWSADYVPEGADYQPSQGRALPTTRTWRRRSPWRRDDAAAHADSAAGRRGYGPSASPSTGEQP